MGDRSIAEHVGVRKRQLTAAPLVSLPATLPRVAVEAGPIIPLHFGKCEAAQRLFRRSVSDLARPWRRAGRFTA